MTNVLTKIIAHKKSEIKKLLNRQDLLQVKPRIGNKSFKDSLLQKGLSVIAEIKRTSPSKGRLSNISSPSSLAQKYLKGGANAISVLTDKEFFAGSTHDLIEVSNTAKDTSITILRKDFIIHPMQINESVLIGADAVLLIVAALKDKLKEMIEYAKKKNIEVLVEIYDESELKIALDAGAEVIGINNRNLKTFQTDINNSLDLIKQISSNVVKISESGIDSPEIAQQLYKAGFDAILVGEALVCAEDSAKVIQQMRSMR